MTQSVVIPKIGARNSSAKDAVILALSAKWPLSIKEIHSEVQKITSNDLTYQATHKTVNLLLEERVLEKNGKNYQLSANWISNLKNFSTNLEETYSGNGKKYELSADFQGTVKWHFDDYSVFCVEMAKALTKIVDWDKEKKGIGLLRHAWWPFNFKFLDFALLIGMLKPTKKSYILTQSDMPFDHWISKQYLSAGLKDIKLGVELNLENDIIFTSDIITQIRFSDDTKQLQDEVHSRVQNLGDLLEEFVFNKHAGKKIEIEVQITKNPALSTTIRDQLIEKYFGSDEK